MNLHWYFKSGILLFIFLPVATFVVIGVFSLIFFIIPNTIICGLIVGIPITIFGFIDLFKVFTGEDAGSIGLVPYSVLQISLILIFWIFWWLSILENSGKPKEVPKKGISLSRDSCLTEKTIAYYIDGLLPEEAIKCADKHLALCAICRDEVNLAKREKEARVKKAKNDPRFKKLIELQRKKWAILRRMAKLDPEE